MAITKRRWRNLRMANQVPKGKAKAEAITNALKLTCKDLSVISIRSASRDHISRNASAIPAHISLMSKPSRSLRHTHGSPNSDFRVVCSWHGFFPAKIPRNPKCCPFQCFWLFTKTILHGSMLYRRGLKVSMTQVRHLFI